MPSPMIHSAPTPSTKFQSRTLFGLPAVAPAMKAAYPLCDRAGAPACGNVGQPGRPESSRGE